ncbi:MAG: PHP domain-containing protein [Chloroflexota bacterium]|nr:PHP domain-containing protein [Chloroflexota bacterium]
MHTHFDASPDSRTPVEEQARAIRTAGLDVVCATDHNTIEGALRLREVAVGFRVIVGEEIRSRDGEIIGLFLERAIPPELSAEETMSRIKEQGGLVIVPHPFSPTRPNPLRRTALDRLWPLIDALEVLNGRREFPADNAKAARYAREHGIPGAAGSDAHQASEIGRAFVEVEGFQTAEELRQALKTASILKRRRQLGDALRPFRPR